jgi:uncharacterized protein (DUF1778 family)
MSLGQRDETKYERLEMRLVTTSKASLQRAAALKGQSLTDFVIQAALDAAVQTIQAHEAIQLNADASMAFSAALLQPPKPNKALRDAAQRYAKQYRSPS